MRGHGIVFSMGNSACGQCRGVCDRHSDEYYTELPVEQRVGARLQFGRGASFRRGEGTQLYSEATEDGQAWLESVVTILWPHASDAVVTTVLETLKPMLERALKDSFLLKSITFPSLDLGREPPKLMSIKAHPVRLRTLDGMQVDFEASWRSQTDIQIGFELKGPLKRAAMKFTEVSFEGTVSAVVKPLLKELPVIGGVRIACLNIPNIELEIDGMSSQIMLALPGVQQKVGKALTHCIRDSLVLPNCVYVRLAESHHDEYPELVLPLPQGVLRVSVLETRNLPSVWAMQSLSWGWSCLPYVKVSIAQMSHKTATAASADASWPEDSFTDLAVHSLRQRVKVLVYHRQGKKPKELLGSIAEDIDVGTLFAAGRAVEGAADGVREVWLKLDTSDSLVRSNISFRGIIEQPSPTATPETPSGGQTPGSRRASVITSRGPSVKLRITYFELSAREGEPAHEVPPRCRGSDLPPEKATSSLFISHVLPRPAGSAVSTGTAGTLTSGTSFGGSLSGGYGLKAFAFGKKGVPLDTDSGTVSCPKGHQLRDYGTALCDWTCAAHKDSAGCKSGITGPGQTGDMVRIRCAKCEYDLCSKCADARTVTLRCPAGHLLRDGPEDSWTCDGSRSLGACRSHITGFGQTAGMRRITCPVKSCDYDVCQPCADALSPAAEGNAVKPATARLSIVRRPSVLGSELEQLAEEPEAVPIQLLVVTVYSGESEADNVWFRDGQGAELRMTVEGVAMKTPGCTIKREEGQDHDRMPHIIRALSSQGMPAQEIADLVQAKLGYVQNILSAHKAKVCLQWNTLRCFFPDDPATAKLRIEALGPCQDVGVEKASAVLELSLTDHLIRLDAPKRETIRLVPTDPSLKANAAIELDAEISLRTFRQAVPDLSEFPRDDSIFKVQHTLAERTGHDGAIGLLQLS